VVEEKASVSGPHVSFAKVHIKFADETENCYLLKCIMS